MNDERLRQDLLELLNGHATHLSLDAALSEFAPEHRAQRPKGLKSVWEILEHMRVAQEDLLRYMLSPAWVSPLWPDDFWPELPETLSDNAWNTTREGFKHDLAEVKALVKDPSHKLTDEIPHGEGRSYLRQVLLVADHNSYHLAQIVAVRRALNDWQS